jgi:hypothetical protein
MCEMLLALLAEQASIIARLAEITAILSSNNLPIHTNITPDTSGIADIDCKTPAVSAGQVSHQTQQKPIHNIAGITWQDAQKKAEAIVAASGFDSIGKLAAAVGCNKRTLKKAIRNSQKLQEAQNKYKPCPSKAVGLTDKVLEKQELISNPDLPDAEVGELLAELLWETEKQNPALLEQTKKEIQKMTPEQKREMAKTFNRKRITILSPKTQKQYKQT